jgi:hypothetical protein
MCAKLSFCVSSFVIAERPSPHAFPARKNEKRKMANDQSTTAALNLAHTRERPGFGP